MRKKGWQVRCFVHQVFEGLVNRSAEFGVVQHHPTTWCVEPVRHRETAHTAQLQVLAADNILLGLIRSCLQSGACLDKSAADSCRRVVFMHMHAMWELPFVSEEVRCEAVRKPFKLQVPFHLSFIIIIPRHQPKRKRQNYLVSKS